MMIVRACFNCLAVVVCLLAGIATDAQARDPRQGAPVAPPVASSQ